MSQTEPSDAQELINQLWTVAGMILEDASPLAILLDQNISSDQRIEMLRRAAADTASIAAAAEVVARRFAVPK